MVAAVVDKWGRLDCAVNNAGIEGAMAETADYDEADFDKVMAINVKGVFLCMKFELLQMREQGSGSIVNTSSVAGLRGGAMFLPYVGSKHAVIGMTRSAAIEYAERGIRVNAVCPGTVNTAMVERIVDEMGDDVPADIRDVAIGIEATPMKRLGDPAEIANAMVWLSSDAASFITGSVLGVDGGWSAT